MDESESPQSLYAKNLRQAFGYPLRFPEPKPGLPSSYEEHGLHIGDVGYVDDVGMFEVLFNICFPPGHDLHQARSDGLDGLVDLAEVNLNDAPPIVNAFSSGRVICHGVQGSHGDNLKHTQSASCKFISCSTSGSILVLPSGAVRQNLNKSKEDQFRKLAEEYARRWCKFAERKSLYLITGFYKTNSWYLAWYHGAGTIGQIVLERDDAGRYNWNANCDYRESSKENRNENQTVLVSGFKIEVRGWDEHTVVEKLAPQSRSIWYEFALRAWSLLGILIFIWEWMVSRFVSRLSESGTLRHVEGSVRVNRVPPFSQPFHPLDVINRFLLDKQPGGQIAVTHDSQWLHMLEMGELSHEEMTEEEHFLAFLEENYASGANSDNVVYLRRRSDDHDEPMNQDHVTAPRKPALSPRTFSFPTSGNIRRIVVTHMRAENTVACLRRMPVGFYVLIEYEGLKRRSKPKAVLLRDSVIEWEDEIILPTDSSTNVQLSVNASFEIDPTLGNGQTICSSEISMGELAEAGSRCLRFQSGSKKGDPSLLVTIEERLLGCYADRNDRNLECEDPLYVAVAKETDGGHDALLRYHGSHEESELKKSIEHFTRALGLCPFDHECRPAALSNFATARYVNCQVHGRISELDGVIASYRETLVLRQVPHPDRPRTLLHLAEALLYRHGRSRHEPSVADEIKGLAAEVKRICHGDSHEHRAADLIVQTLKRYQILASGTLVELDELVHEFSRSAQVSPDWYFDRPYRMINLSAVLRKRFELTSVPDHLEKSFLVMGEAAQLISDGHFDKPWMLAFLGDTLCIRFVRRGDPADLAKSISTIEAAMKLTPDGHVDKPWMVARLGVALLAQFICGSAFGLNVSISMTRSVIHLTPKARVHQLNEFHKSTVTGTQGTGDISDLGRSIPSLRDAAEHLVDSSPNRPCCLGNLASALLVRFWCLGDSDDIEEAVLRFRDAVKLGPSSCSDRLVCLNNLGLSLSARFEQTKDVTYLEEAISKYKEAVERIPDGHSDKPSYLNNLGNSLASRFECLGGLSDIEAAISNHRDAVALTPAGHSNKSIYLNSLALSFRIRFERVGEMNDIEEAISNHIDAVRLAPDGHPEKARHSNDLALTLEARFVHLEKLKELGLLRAVTLS